jgi:inward rectifier potassium channel
MSNKPTKVTVQAGHWEFVKINAGNFDWRDTYHWILMLPWSRFAAVLLGIYLVVNLFFATFYTLGGRCVAELPPGSFLDAFFFSVETLATVGYGHMYPDTFYGHCVTTVEIVVGMFGMAVVTGLIFVRFARPTAKITFSKNIVIAPFNGVPTLTIRVANLRHHSMAEARFRMIVMLDEITLEKEDVRRFYPLKLLMSHAIAFPVAMTLRHPIDETSPLWGMTPEDFIRTDAAILASIVCIDTVIPASIQSQAAYDAGDILWNHRFVEIYTETEEGRYTVDYGRLHDTEPVEAIAQIVGSE